MGSRPSSGETRLTCVPRTTTRPSFLVLSNTRSESSGSGPGHFEMKKKERYHGTKWCCEIYMCQKFRETADKMLRYTDAPPTLRQSSM